MPKHYRTIKLPREMVEAIEQLLSKHPELGYVSIADYVKDSIRHNYHKHKRTLKTQLSHG